MISSSWGLCHVIRRPSFLCPEGCDWGQCIFFDRRIASVEMRFQNRLEVSFCGSVEALKEISREKVVTENRCYPAIEQAILKMAFEQPA